MFLGVLYGVLACMIWGLIYIIPLLLPQYDPIFIATGRFICFGLFALPLLWIEREEFRHYTVSDWISVLKLGFFGNVVYFWFLIQCIQNAGAPLAGMCMAVIPVLTALVANRRDRTIAWGKLIPSLILIAVGLFVANMSEFRFVIESGQGTTAKFFYGVFAGVCALLLWTWYPIYNADWLQKHPRRSARAWSTAQGLAVLIPAAILFFATWKISYAGLPLLGPTPGRFVGLMLVAGLLCSWLGIYFWNAMSQKLPTALGGQMIVFETIFAVIYAHVYRNQMPILTLVLGMVFLIGGVLVALRAFKGKAL